MFFYLHIPDSQLISGHVTPTQTAERLRQKGGYWAKIGENPYTFRSTWPV